MRLIDVLNENDHWTVEDLDALISEMVTTASIGTVPMPFAGRKDDYAFGKRKKFAPRGLKQALDYLGAR